MPRGQGQVGVTTGGAAIFARKIKTNEKVKQFFATPLAEYISHIKPPKNGKQFQRELALIAQKLLGDEKVRVAGNPALLVPNNTLHNALARTYLRLEDESPDYTRQWTKNFKPFLEENLAVYQDIYSRVETGEIRTHKKYFKSPELLLMFECYENTPNALIKKWPGTASERNDLIGFWVEAKERLFGQVKTSS